MSFHSLVAHFFLPLNSFLSSGCNTIYFSVHPPKDTLVASQFCKLGIKLLNTFMCSFLYGCMISTHFGQYQRVQLLDHIVKSVFSFTRNLVNCLQMWLHHFAFPPAMNESSRGSTSSPAYGVVRVLDFPYFNRCVAVLITFFKQFKKKQPRRTAASARNWNNSQISFIILSVCFPPKVPKLLIRH